MFRVPKEALAKAVEYTSKGIELSHELQPDNLSYVYASQCAKRKDKSTLKEMLSYLSDPSRRARFLKIGGLYSEALKEYVNNDELDDAYRLASGQCMFSEGREIAKTHNNSKREAEFVFHQIHSEHIKSREKGSAPFPFMKSERDLLALKKTEDPMTKAQACLLLGVVNRDAALCRAAHGTFVRLNKAAALEAFDALTSLVRDHQQRPKIDQVLLSCRNARDLKNALETMGDLNQLVKQATAFYGIQKVRDVYLTPPNHNMWVSLKLKTHCLLKDDNDIDGLLRLDVAATREVLAAHVGSFITKWLEEYGTENTITTKVIRFKLHSDIQRKKFLLYLSTKNELPPQSLNEYINNLVRQCKLGVVLANQKTCDMAVSTLLAVFSPQVSIHLPLTKEHVAVMRRSTSIHSFFQETIKAFLDHRHLNRMDEWFSAWRACCLTDGKLVDATLEKLEAKVNDRFKDKSAPSTDSESCGFWRKNGSFQAPAAYEYWKLEDHYYHVFSFWLNSCTLVKEKKPIWAAKQAIYHFLGTISQRKSLSISVMNLVNVLIVHCTGLFTMLTQLNQQEKKMLAKFVIPVHYPACVDLFDSLNCKEKECTLLSVCFDEVRHCFRRKQPHRLRNDCCKLLDAALAILLGNYRKDNSLPPEEQKNFRVLRFAFRNEKVVKSGVARHCLVLALTVFANLRPYQLQNRWEASRREFVSFFDEVSNQENLPDDVKNGKKVFQTSQQQMLQSNVLQYVGQLLSTVCAKGTPTQAMMASDKGKITYTPLPTAGINPPQLPSAPKVSTGHPAGFVQTESTRKKVSIRNLQSPSTPEPSQPLVQDRQLPVTAAVQPARHPENVFDSHPAPTAVAPSAAHLVHEAQEQSVSVGAPSAQPTERKWHNLPPVLDSLLQPPSTQTPLLPFGYEQPLGQTQTTWDPNLYQMTDPLSFNQTNIEQQSTYTALPQNTSMMFPGSQIFEQPLQQQLHPGSLAAPFGTSLQPPSQPTWDFAQPYDQPYDGSTDQYGGGGSNDQLPWPDFPAYSTQQTVKGTHPGSYYPPLVEQQQQPPLDPSGSFSSYSSTMTSNFNWDPLARDYSHQSKTEHGIPYGDQYQQSTVTQLPYRTLPSEVPAAAMPLHIELASQINENAGVQPPPTTTYVPPPTESVSANKGSPGEVVESSQLLGSVPLSKVYDTNLQPTRVQESQNQDAPPPVSASQPTTMFEEAIFQQQDVETEAHDETSGLFTNSSEDKEHVPEEEQEEETIVEQEIQEVEETLEDEEGGYGEMDEDDKAPGMSALRRSVWPHLPPVDPHLIDPSIVTEEFCNICGTVLKSKHAAEESEGPGEGEDSLLESYDSHVRSDAHDQKYTLHQNFREKFDKCYTVMVEELSALLHKCERTQAPSLTRLTDDMHETLDKYERKMAERQANLSWKLGLTLIDKATDDFQRLLNRGNKQYEKFKSEHPLLTERVGRDVGGGTPGGDSDTEFHEEINKTVPEVEDDFTLTLRSEESKLESRSRKKVKKRKR